MEKIFVTLLGIACMVFLLWIFYTSVQTNWPENYFTASGDFGVVVNRSATRYLLFICIPPYFVSLLCAALVENHGGFATFCGVGGALIHAGRTQIRHMVGVAKRSRSHTKISSLLVGVVATCGILSASFLGTLGPGPFSDVIPPTDEIFNSLWGAALVALIAVAILKVSRNNTDIERLIVRSRKEVGQPLINLAISEAEGSGTDPLLVETILLTENLERPRWTRRAERVKGKVFRKGTYGIMQVYRETGPVADEESIRIAVREHLAGITTGRIGSDYAVPDLIRALRRYNADPNFIDLATRIYSSLVFESYFRNVPDSEEEEEGSIEERIDLAFEIWTEMLVRVRASPQDGIASIAGVPTKSLRSLAMAMSCLPQIRDSEAEAGKEEARDRLARINVGGTFADQDNE